jgi:hypothetical protein
MQLGNIRGPSTENIERLAFANPAFHSGLNVTVRLGDKWFKRVKPGDNVILANLREEIKYVVRVTRVHLYDHFKYLPVEDIRCEHDPACRTKLGLFETMKKIYPGFTEDDPVTVVEFDV